MEVSKKVHALKHLPSMAIRAVSIEASRITPKRKKITKLFNLDLHVSVIRDLSVGLSDFSVELTSWSISRHNYVYRKFFGAPDPVKFINAGSWQNLDEGRISRFLEHYKRHLDGFDGFVVTHSPSFHEIFKSLGKPILIVNSTRYEAPFTDKPQAWNDLNKSLIESVKRGQAHMYSNNEGDRRYLEHFTGINTRVVPSVCDYTAAKWRGSNAERVYLVNRIPQEIRNKLLGLKTWKPSTAVFGRHFSWSQMQQVGGVFLIPYNVSTMQLFEFATAGIPVVVPSARFLGELFSDASALQELSYFQTQKISPAGLDLDNPNNYFSPNFVKFWLDSADFYNQDLMPNVMTVDSFEELDSLDLPHCDTKYLSILHSRNISYKEQRHKMLASFVEAL